MPAASHQLLIISSNTISPVNHCELIVDVGQAEARAAQSRRGGSNRHGEQNLRQGRRTCGTWRRRAVAPRRGAANDSQDGQSLLDASSAGAAASDAERSGALRLLIITSRG